jgi:hypothetical protein
VTPHDPVPRFDEKAALPELERLRDAIQAARQERQRKSEEFDQFVRGFRRPAPDVPLEDVPAPRAPEPPQSAPVSTSSAQPQSEPQPEPVEAPATTATVAPESVPTDTLPSPKPRSASWPMPRAAMLAVAAGAILAVVVSLLLLNRSPKQASAVAPSTSASATSPTRPVQPSPPAAKAPVAAAPRGVTVQLRTAEAVWMRVTVDGQKKLESLVPAGQQLQFSGDRAIVVRAGNGGGVLVKTGSREEPFGDAGQPLTRTFLKPGPR